ncbi:MAG TPA: hypothetical protein VFO93_15740 [Hymenobacter sp.]|uniref:hypothetical protein n=1 Tax=Hymenobacter sp. TaxID=1898978 RepID=UPI002D8043D5|nr:hypothetical protein [Hymenobacter sp.]HET9504995.1 hypothetical protein [Hymenobacter sp.]
MHTPTSFRWLLALLLAFGCFSAARATHIRGGDITYATIASTTAGVPRYHVVVRNFVEIGSAATSSAVSLNANRGGCNASTPISFPTVPRTQLFNSSLQTCGTVNPLYQIAVYEIDIDLPLPTGPWVLSSFSGARTGTIMNLQNPLSQNIYLTAYLDNSVVTQDISPVFQSLLQPIVGTSAPMPFSMSAFDADGDSLAYELIQPANACNQPIPYNPSNFAPHYTISAATGALTATAAASTSAQGYYVIAAKVSAYRKMGNNRWLLVGYVIRDTMYLLFPNTNQPPTFTTMQVNGGAAQPLSTTVTALPGQTVNVLLQATDPDATQQLRFASAAAGVVPGLSLAQVGTTGSAQLSWQVPATLPPGRYPLIISVFDNGCPYNASEERTIVFVVNGNRPLATRAAATATDVYPVPFREQVQFTTAPNQAVILVDALGREVARLTSSATGLVRWQPTAALPAGLYLARSAASGQPLARLLRAE